MEIYVVKPGDTIYSIAGKYGITVMRLIRDNGFEYPLNLVVGQAIIITFPQQLYTVQKGDTLAGIAASYGVTTLQLLRNNSYLSERKYIYPGEELVISYKTTGSTIVNGYAYPYIAKDILIRTLPYLTYLSVFNYRVLEKGDIITYREDEDIVQLAISYGVVPLLMISSISLQGEFDVETVNEILSNADKQDFFVNQLIDRLKITKYKGINISINNLTPENQESYISVLEKISERIRSEGYQIFATINPNLNNTDQAKTNEEIDYGRISQLVEGITFSQLLWGNNKNPPSPVSSIDEMNSFIKPVIEQMPPDKIIMGMPLIGFDWELPYIPDKSVAHALTLNSAITLAGDVGTVIQFDEISQTPFYLYNSIEIGAEIDHIVWFVDVRSINALHRLIAQYHLSGFGFWNINIFYQQIWSYIISQYEIVKLLPELIS